MLPLYAIFFSPSLNETINLSDDDEKIEALTYLGDKFFPTHEETMDEINRLLDRTEVFEITVEHMSGKVVEEK